MKSYHALDIVAVVLLIISGINWGLVGLFDFDLITSVFGMAFARMAFTVFGIAAIYRAVKLIKVNISR